MMTASLLAWRWLATAAALACTLIACRREMQRQPSSGVPATQRAGPQLAGPPAAGAPPAGSPAAGRDGAVSAVAPLQDIDAATVLQLNERWTGDFDWHGERRFLRALVPFSRMFYYLDGPRQAGAAFESLQEFEKALREQAPRGVVPPKIVIIPTARDRVLPALAAGLGDIALGGFAITDDRTAIVDFSAPIAEDIKDIVVTGPASNATFATIDDLGGHAVHVRRSSSYHEDLRALNERLTRAGKPPIVIIDADERLEDEDLLQMVDAGIAPATVVKDGYATFWAQLYDQLTVHSDLVVRDQVKAAWAVRKNTPHLQRVVNDFVRTHRVGTMFGNVLLKKYLGSPVRLKNPSAQRDLERFRQIATYLQQYSAQYRVDWLLVAAQGYQESQLDQTRRSAAGAVGVMQIKPETAADPSVGIHGVTEVGNNIHAGVKYLRFMVDRYFSDAPIDRLNKGLFALAAYNAGPARVARLRRTAKAQGLDPNQWFYNVEIIAAREIGRETVDYVSNIYKYYTAYKGIAARRARAASPAPGSR
jgi:membrane-bound lytic murein transglycosylase MltF